MPRPAKLDLAKRINSLQVERERLQARLQEIDSILGQARNALGMVRGSQPDPVATSDLPKVARGTRRHRRKFAVNGLESVLKFVRDNKNATTATINANWKSEGRAGRADVTLGKLVAEKKLKRVKMKGERGSRYVVS